MYDPNRISEAKSVTVPLGDGTAAFPYEIATAAQLKNVSDNVNAGTHKDRYFRQTANLDLSAYNTGTGWVPIGSTGSPFSGSYDGGNFTISNLFINNGSVDYQGLFGSINAPATAVTMENINLVNVNVTGGNYTGSLAGFIDGTGAGVTITNCTVSGNSNITGSGDTGGMAGYLNNTVVSQCSVISTGTGVTGSSNNIGGFAGSITTGTTVTDCYSKADISVSGSADNAAGFIGYIVTSDCQVVTSFARGDVTNSSSSFNRIGGFAGMNTGIVTNCYSTGDVQSAGADYGGFIGYTDTGSVITNCYSVGEVTGSGTNDGGFIGAYNAGSFTNCYWLMISGGINDGLPNSGTGTISSGVDSRDQTQMKTQATYTGWSFGAVWDISAGYYPYMIYETWDFPF